MVAKTEQSFGRVWVALPLAPDNVVTAFLGITHRMLHRAHSIVDMPEPFTQIPLFPTLLFVELSLGENWRCPSSDKGEPSQPRAKVGGILFFTNSPGEVYLALSLPRVGGLGVKTMEGKCEEL